MRFTTVGADRDRRPHRLRRRARAGDRAGNFRRACRRPSQRERARAGRDRRGARRARLPWPRWPSWRVSEGYMRPIIDDSQHVRHSRRPPSRGRAGLEELPAAAPSSRTIACWRRRAPRCRAGFDEMPEARIWLVTGPNMAGKSTFLRQNALIAVLAQMGSFVPARSAHIGVVDRMFQPRRRRRRPGARPLHLHGRDGGDGRHPQPGDRPLAGHPRRDRPRHRDLRRPLDRLGGGRVPARGQSPAARCSPRTTTS